VISKNDKEYMQSEAYRKEHDAQAYKMQLNALLDRGFNLKQIAALEREAENVFGTDTKLRS